MWRFGCIAILPLMLAAPLAAQDGSGCDKFAWSLVTVQAQFAAPNIATVSAGTELSSVPTQAFLLRLQPSANANFIMPPERPLKNDNGFGGAVTFPTIERSGIYQITLSEDAWLDIIQNGQFARSVGSSGRRDCPGLRKSVRLELMKAPFVLQLSGVSSDSVKVSVIQVQ
jgi:hypothetical protein